MTSETFITEMAEVQGLDFRGQGVAPGETIHQDTSLAGTAGAQATWKKAPSKVRMGNIPLPERVALYNLRIRDVSQVPPTIAMKRMSDYPGVYTMKKPADWDTTGPQAIDESCVICNKERAKYGAPPKRFYDELDLEAHYESFHPREYGRIRRELERAERREEQGTTNKLIAAIAAVFQQGRGGELPKEVTDALTEERVCPDCGQAIEGTDGFAKARHRKTCSARKDGS